MQQLIRWRHFQKGKMALASLSDQLKVYLTLLVGPDDLLSLAATCKGTRIASCVS